MLATQARGRGAAARGVGRGRDYERNSSAGRLPRRSRGSASPRPKARWGGGPGGGSPVGSGRGLELGGGLGARERGWASAGVRAGDHPELSPGAGGHGGNSPAPSDSAAPKARNCGRVRCAGPGWGVPRRKWRGAARRGGNGGLRFRGSRSPLARLQRRGSPRWRGRGGAPPGGGGGAPGRGWNLLGLDGGGGAAPPSPSAAGAERARLCTPGAVAGPWSRARPFPPRGRRVCGEAGAQVRPARTGADGRGPQGGCGPLLP